MQIERYEPKASQDSKLIYNVRSPIVLKAQVLRKLPYNVLYVHRVVSTLKNLDYLEHKPAFVSLAMRIASSSVLNLIRGATGPNTSSLERRN